MLSRRSKADAQNNYSSKSPGDASEPCPDAEQPTSEDEETENHWVEIELVDEDNKPIAGETYRVSLADGTIVKEGSLDPQGKAHVEGITAEMCLISFPNLYEDAWEEMGDD